MHVNRLMESSRQRQKLSSLPKMEQLTNQVWQSIFFPPMKGKVDIN